MARRRVLMTSYSGTATAHLSLASQFAPTGASGQRLIAQDASGPATAPVSRVPTARLRATFQAGDRAGEYGLTVGLVGGNRLELFVRAH